MADGKDELRALISKVGRELGRSDAEIQSIGTRLIDEEWFDSIASIQNLAIDDWNRLNLPVRFANAFKKALEAHKNDAEDKAPASQSVSSPSSAAAATARAETTKALESEDNSISYEPADPGRDEWAAASLDLILKTLVATCDKTLLPSCLLTLHKIVQALLVAPQDLTKRKIRMANPAFKRNVGTILEALQFLEAVGFKKVKAEADEETFLMIPTLYISRLSDAEALLSKALQKTGAASTQNLSQRIVKPAFNPYRSNVSTSRSDADRLAGMVADDRDPNILRKKIKLAKRIRARGGSDGPVPLNKILYPPGVTPPIFPDAQICDTDGDGGPVMTTQQLARLSETLSGKTQFRSTLKDELDALNAQPIFEKTTLRIYAPDKAILQVSFRNDTKVSEVLQVLIEKAFSKELLDLLGRMPGGSVWLFESPPIRRLKEDETLYEQGRMTGDAGKSFAGTSITIGVKNEDHTLGNAIRSMLNKHRDVEFAGYTIPHPTLPEMNIRLQTHGDRPAVDVLQEALDNVGDLVAHVAATFDAALDAHPAMSEH